MTATLPDRTRPKSPAASRPRSEPASSAGFSARVSLGNDAAPVASDFVLLLATALLLTGLGLVMVLSATMATGIAAGISPFETVLKQASFAVIGIPMMLIASRMPVTFWKKIAWPALIMAVCFQLLVFVPGLGDHHDGNQNWIVVGGFQAQPSEFLKLTLAIWLGLVLSRKHTHLGVWHHVFIPVVPVGALVIGTVLAGHDLGTALILMVILLGCLFFSGVKLRIFVLPTALVIAAAAFFAMTSQNRMSRILNLFNVDNVKCYSAGIGESCYQALHGIWGLSSGGVFGLGLGNSREKYAWLPAASNDYIFAIVGEELGLVGCLVVLSLFAVFAIGAFNVIRKTRDPFVRVVAGGITIWIVGQALINVGVVLRLLPVLGVPLPFMSQGGTALLSVLLACGVLLSLARSLPAENSFDVPVPTPTRSRARVAR